MKSNEELRMVTDEKLSKLKQFKSTADNAQEAAVESYKSQPRVPSSRRGSIQQLGCITGETEQEQALIRKFVSEIKRNNSKRLVTNDHELAQRIAEYYNECAETGTVPCIEEMYLSTGFSIGECEDIVNRRTKGFSTNTWRVLQRGRDFQRVFDAKLVIAGKINITAYIFRAKNYYNMRDQYDVNVTPRDPIGETKTRQQLVEQYQQGMETIESDYFEVKDDSAPEGQ